MFENFSEGARRIVFFSRKLAGRRGAAAIGMADLIAALVVEDQGDFREIFPENTALGAAVQVLPQRRAFLTAETAAAIQRGLEALLAKAKPLPDSVDMPISDDLKDLFAAAISLSEEPTPAHTRVGHVEPLHLLAAALSEETSPTADVLKQMGIRKEAVVAAIQSGEYS